MPATEVFFFKDEDGSVPVLDWLHSFRERNERALKERVPTREIHQAAARIEKYKVDPEAFRLSVDEEGNENG